MSKNLESPSNSNEKVIDGSTKFAANAHKKKMQKLVSRFVFAGVVAAAVVVAAKYVSTPVPEWADDSEDV